MIRDRHKKAGPNVQHAILGDVLFADDTTLLGLADEVHIATEILIQTMKDWGETAHPGKTERLRLSGDGRRDYDCRLPGETGVVRHVGGWISEDGKQQTDTKKRCIRTYGVIRQVSKAWSLGTKHGRGQGSKLPIHTRLSVLKSMVIPSLTCFNRSRKWSKGEIAKIQRVANYAVRRAFGVDRFLMRDHHIHDVDMYNAAGWDLMGDLLHRQALQWLGHVAQMLTAWV